VRARAEDFECLAQREAAGTEPLPGGERGQGPVGDRPTRPAPGAYGNPSRAPIPARVSAPYPGSCRPTLFRAAGPSGGCHADRSRRADRPLPSIGRLPAAAPRSSPPDGALARDRAMDGRPRRPADRVPARRRRQPRPAAAIAGPAGRRSRGPRGAGGNPARLPLLRRIGSDLRLPPSHRDRPGGRGGVRLPDGGARLARGLPAGRPGGPARLPGGVVRGRRRHRRPRRTGRGPGGRFPDTGGDGVRAPAGQRAGTAGRGASHRPAGAEVGRRPALPTP
jgi:hypothetical protein